MHHLVGAGKARELHFTGQVVLGDGAARIGLVNRAVPAAQLAALPTAAIGYMKRNPILGLRASLSDVLDADVVHMVRTFETEDHKGAAVAFVEKRPPQCAGR